MDHPATRGARPLGAALIACCAATVCAAGAAGAGARPTLATLDRATVERLVPLLSKGELVLVESADTGRLKQVSWLALAKASPAQVLEVVARPEDYPKFVPNLVEVTIRQREGLLTDVAYELEVPFVNLRGVNRVLDERPKRVRYWPVEGDIKRGDWEWRAYDLGDGRSVVASYAYQDVRDASWFIRKMVEARPTLEHAAVLATTLVMLKAVCDEAARRAGQPVVGRPKKGSHAALKLDSIARDLSGNVGRAVMRLAQRGEVALVQSRPDGTLAQVAVMARYDQPPAAAWAVASDPARYPEFMPTVERIEILERTAERIRYVHVFKVPLIELSVLSEMRLLPRHRLAMRITGGDLKRGTYAWEFLPADGGRQTLALFYANTDIREQSWFLEKLVEREPYFEHGLNVGLGLVSTRAVGRRTAAQAGLAP